MLSKLFVVSSILAVALAGTQARQNTQLVPGAAEPLEIQITKPLQWQNGCLLVSMDRVNRSKATLFLPLMGLYISSSAIEAGEDAEDAGNSGEPEWIVIYGLTDLIDWDATPLAAGERVHDEHCFPPAAAVVNLDKETRRQIPLRGTLRIDASYFLTESDWRQNKFVHEEMMREMPPAKAAPAKWRGVNPETTTMIAVIPCREGDCSALCDSAPVILHGEKRIVPDVFNEPDWEARGKTINEELAKSSPCHTP